MSENDWEEVRKALQITYYSVELKIDGYNVSLVLERVSAFKNVILVYIDGKFKSEWLSDDCEIRRRFANKKTKALFTKKGLAKGEKLTKKREKEIDRFLKEHQDVKYEYFVPYWTNFNSLKKHLIKHNENIERVNE